MYFGRSQKTINIVAKSIIALTDDSKCNYKVLWPGGYFPNFQNNQFAFSFKSDTTN